MAQDNARFRIENIYSNFWRLCQMHADGKSTLASVSKWNSVKVNWSCKSYQGYIIFISISDEIYKKVQQLFHW